MLSILVSILMLHERWKIHRLYKLVVIIEITTPSLIIGTKSSKSIDNDALPFNNAQVTYIENLLEVPSDTLFSD